MGGPEAIRGPDLQAEGTPGPAPRVRRSPRLRGGADPRRDHERDPTHSRGERYEGRRPHPADAVAWREDHVGYGPAAQPLRSVAHCPGRAQAAGLRAGWDPPRHELDPSPAARCSGSQDPSRQPDPLHSGQDRGQPGRSGRRADARHAGLHRGDERHPRLRRPVRAGGHGDDPGVPRGNHASHGAGVVREERDPR